jgi:glycosyltransferase involved in cell wall biosynthesis
VSISKLAIFFDRFGPYHIARIGAVARQFDVLGVEFFGVSDAYAWDRVDVGEAFDRNTLFAGKQRPEVTASQLYRAIAAQLSAYGADVVAVPGWAHTGSLAAMLWCGQNNTPVIMMSETSKKDFKRSYWKELPKRRIVSQCSAGLVGGPEHRAYLASLGLSEDRIFLGYDVVDNEHFREGAYQVRREDDKKRAKRNLPETYFLASCRFIPKKNLPRLIMAYKTYRQQVPSHEAWDLVLLGDGEERTFIERKIQTLDLTDVVHMPGFKQYHDLPAYYGLAGAFVHASTREQWGLVVNEAMAAGLPVLVSDRCGCAGSLVEHGSNGFVFDPYNIDALAEAMLVIASDSDARQRMGARSKDIIREWGPDRFGSGMQKAVKSALRINPPSTSWSDSLLIKGLMHR